MVSKPPNPLVVPRGLVCVSVTRLLPRRPTGRVWHVDPSSGRVRRHFGGGRGKVRLGVVKTTESPGEGPSRNLRTEGPPDGLRVWRRRSRGSVSPVDGTGG